MRRKYVNLQLFEGLFKGGKAFINGRESSTNSIAQCLLDVIFATDWPTRPAGFEDGQ